MARQSQSDAGNEDRPEWILKQAELKHAVTFREIAERYGRSSAQHTLRELVLQGRLVRASHGSYTLPVERADVEGLWGSPYANKLALTDPVKQALARHIAIKHCKAKYDELGAVKLGLDAGSSCTSVGEALTHVDISVERLYTSNLDATLHLMNEKRVLEIRLKGGTVSKEHACVCGEMGNDEINWNVDVAILGVSRVFVHTDESGRHFVALYTADKTQWAFKQWLASSETVIIPVLAEKIGRPSEDFFARVYKEVSGQEIDGREFDGPFVCHGDATPDSQQRVNPQGNESEGATAPARPPKTKRRHRVVLVVAGKAKEEECDRLAVQSGIEIDRVSLPT